jgi:hypothetical protein
MADRIFGELPGVPEGTLFEDRTELSKAGVHRPRQAGICGGKGEGAESIVLSGGYEDDIDSGDVIVYTGHGGNIPRTATQYQDQELDRQNMALVISCKNLGCPSGSCVVPNTGQLGVQRPGMSTVGYTELFIGGSSAVSLDSKYIGSSCERLGAMQRRRWPINRANRLMTGFRNNSSNVQERWSLVQLRN